MEAWAIDTAAAAGSDQPLPSCGVLLVFADGA